MTDKANEPEEDMADKPGTSSLIHREDGKLEVRTVDSKWEIRHSGRPNEAFTIRGYPAVFNSLSLDLGGFREQILPEAFDEVLAKNPDVHFVWDHDTRYVLARTANGTLTLSTDNIGLLIDAQVGQYSWSKDLKLALERRDIDQGSFAFTVSPEGDDWDYAEDGTITRTIRKLDGLFDVTVTAKGAYPQTSLAAVRGLLKAAAVEGRLPEAGAERVAEQIQGEQPSQEGGLDEETKKRVERLLNQNRVLRDEVSDLVERAEKL